MSSPPAERTLEGLIADAWGPIAVCPDVLTLLEPYRERVEYLLDAFEDETQSWRDYCACIYGEALPNEAMDKVDELVTTLLCDRYVP